MNQLPSETFEQRFYAQLDKPPSRRETLERLEKLGCDANFLLIWVELWCGLKEKRKPARGVKGFVMSKRSLSALMKQFAKRLLEDADEIERLNRVLEVSPELSWSASVPIDLSNRIRSFASGLNSESKKLNNRWSRALRTEPGNAVRLLTEYVNSTTGKKRYPDVADLLEVGYRAHGWATTVTADDVRKMATGASTRQRSSG
jgi:hypothetical protein